MTGSKKKEEPKKKKRENVCSFFVVYVQELFSIYSIDTVVNEVEEENKNGV